MPRVLRMKPHQHQSSAAPFPPPTLLLPANYLFISICLFGLKGDLNRSMGLPNIALHIDWQRFTL